jgi:hypothetical protein
VPRRRRREVLEPHGLVLGAQQVVDEHRLRRGAQRVQLLGQHAAVERRPVRRLDAVQQPEELTGALGAGDRLVQPARVPLGRLTQHLAQVTAGVGGVGEIGDAVGREVRAAGGQRRLAHRLADPRVEAVRDHIVELAELSVGQGEDVAHLEAQVVEPCCGRRRTRFRDRAGREIDPERGGIRARRGDAGEVRARAAPELQHPRAPWVGRSQPVQRSDRREDGGPRLREREVRVRHLVIDRAHVFAIFSHAAVQRV